MKMQILQMEVYLLHCYFKYVISMVRSFVHAVYFPSWKIYQNKTPEALDVTAITHVFYAFIGYEYRPPFLSLC